MCKFIVAAIQSLNPANDASETVMIDLCYSVVNYLLSLVVTSDDDTLIDFDRTVNAYMMGRRILAVHYESCLRGDSVTAPVIARRTAAIFPALWQLWLGVVLPVATFLPP